MKKKRKWIKRTVVLALLAVVALGAFLLVRGKESVAYTEIPVTEGSLTTYYNFDGLVHAPRVQTLTAEEAGTVRTVYVGQNDAVREGDRIYRLDGGATVEADMDGEVTGLYISEGDVVSGGDTVAQIIDMERLEVQLDVDEYDVRAVVPGSAVSVTILATGDTFDTTVSALDKNGTASGDLSYYTATAKMGAIEGAYPGMQVSAKVLREPAEHAALLRVDAIQFDETNVPYVLVDKGGSEPEKVPVEVGMSDGLHCVIVSGVSAGDVVLKPSGMTMREFMELARSNNPMLQ